MYNWIIRQIKKWGWPEWMMIIVSICVIFAPAIFSKTCGSIVFDEHTGAIGDTIGGITAPFINLLAAWLVYKALMAQLDNNKSLKEQNTFSSLSISVIESVKLLKEDIEKFAYAEKFGLDAITITMDEIVKRKTKKGGLYPPDSVALTNFIRRIHIITNSIDKSEIPDESKGQLMTFVYSLYAHYFLKSYLKYKLQLYSNEITIISVKYREYNKSIVEIIEKNTELTIDIDNILNEI